MSDHGFSPVLAFDRPRSENARNGDFWTRVAMVRRRSNGRRLQRERLELQAKPKEPRTLGERRAA
jgi:hypothetical protein